MSSSDFPAARHSLPPGPSGEGDFNEGESMARNDREITVTLNLRCRATTDDGRPTTRRTIDEDELRDLADKLALGLPMRDVQDALMEGTDCRVSVIACELVTAQVHY
ncbi:hypothetical protein D9621_32485 (plasmid) [Azospirillum brasilense]|nr:hypothetical protein D9621_27730 [Azospirillum brasilense]QEL94850.1 hypothetical protein D9621_32485 [Azospirillum brasilense]